jgi:hypothetical protein
LQGVISLYNNHKITSEQLIETQDPKPKTQDWRLGTENKKIATEESETFLVQKFYKIKFCEALERRFVQVPHFFFEKDATAGKIRVSSYLFPVSSTRLETTRTKL